MDIKKTRLGKYEVEKAINFGFIYKLKSLLPHWTVKRYEIINLGKGN